VATAFASGTGTEADPFVIKTPEQLAFLAQSVKGGESYEGKFIVLGADIDLGGKEWLPIGLYKYENTSGNDFPFNGNFDGKGYSRGKAKRSLSLVKTMPVEWSGTVAKAYVGVRLRDALEVQFIIHGAPHTPKDTNLYNAIKVKGKHKKKVEEIQKEEFNKVIEEALSNG
jgi:hypothetical protein